MPKKQPSGQSLYTQLEDHYYGFMDELEEVLPIYSWFVDPIESARIPSFPVAVLLVLVLLVGGVWISSANSAPKTTALLVVVTYADGTLVNGARVLAMQGDVLLTSASTSSGQAILTGIPNGALLLKVEKEGYPSKSLLLDTLPRDGKVALQLLGQAPLAAFDLTGVNQSGFPDINKVQNLVNNPEAIKDLTSRNLGELG